MSKYLVTGAAGYVGHEVVRQLQAAGEDVIGLDFRDPQMDQICYIHADITDLDELLAATEDIEFDYIFHIASLPGDTGIPRQMVNVNVCGCVDMLELARLKNAKRIVVVSSISAYEWYPAVKFSPPDYMPVDEAHPLRPKDMYSATKQMQEILTTVFFHEYDVPACAIRLAAVVGPNGQGGGRGWRTIAEELAGGISVQIPHFTMEERCHYVDIRDVARMLVHCATHDSASGKIFNCCGPAAVSGYELADIIKAQFPGIEVTTGFPWSMAQGGELAFSMDKAETVMGYKPRYSMNDSISYIKQWIDADGLTAKVERKEKFGGGVDVD